MNSFRDRTTPEVLNYLNKTGISMFKSSQSSFGLAIALCRAAPENISLDYKSRHFLGRELTDDVKGHFKFAKYGVRYDKSGRPLPYENENREKDDFYYEDVDKEGWAHCKGSPWENIKKFHKFYILPAIAGLDYEEMLKRYRTIFKYIVDALLIEERALDCLRYSGKMRLGDTEMPVSKINPMARDLWNLPPILSGCTSAPQKGPLTLLGEYFKARDNKRSRGTRNFMDIVERTLNGKMGAAAVRILVGMERDRSLRLCAKLSVIGRNNHTPVVSPDLSTLGHIVRNAKDGKEALSMWLFSCNSNVPGFIFEDASLSSHFKLLCSTAEIFTPIPVCVGIPRLALLNFARGRQSSLAAVTRSESLWVASNFSSGGGKGAEAGFNPGRGATCTSDVFFRLKESVIRTLDNKDTGTGTGIMDEIARREAASMDSTLPIVNKEFVESKADFSWDVFFHSRLPEDPAPPRKRPADREESSRPKMRRRDQEMESESI